MLYLHKTSGVVLARAITHLPVHASSSGCLLVADAVETPHREPPDCGALGTEVNGQIRACPVQAPLFNAFKP